MRLLNKMANANFSKLFIEKPEATDDRLSTHHQFPEFFFQFSLTHDLWSSDGLSERFVRRREMDQWRLFPDGRAEKSYSRISSMVLPKNAFPESPKSFSNVLISFHDCIHKILLANSKNNSL